MEEKNICVICLSDTDSSDYQLYCKHIYHNNCIQEVKNNKCPLCREYIINDIDDSDNGSEYIDNGNNNCKLYMYSYMFIIILLAIIGIIYYLINTIQ